MFAPPNNGNCLNHPDTNWFPHHNDRTSQATALAICTDCPVRTDCLRTSLTTIETIEHGLWGGTLREERRRLSREGVTPDGPHGTLTGYCGPLKCRCPLCADAYRAYDRGRAAANLRKMARYRRNSTARRREIVSVTNTPGQNACDRASTAVSRDGHTARSGSNP